MPSYTEEQKRRAVDMIEGCGGSVTRAMRRLGYPTRQTLYHWLNRRDASHERRSGRPWSHYDPALKAQAVTFVRSGMASKDVAEMLGVSSAAVVYNWARAAEDPSPYGGGQEPHRTHERFRGQGVRRLRGEPRGARAPARARERHPEGGGEGFKSRKPQRDGEQGEGPGHKRAAGDDGEKLERAHRFFEDTKSSYEYQRAALCRPDRHAGLRARVREAFEGASALRGYRYVTHALRSGDDPIAVSEKVVCRIMREEGLAVAYAKRRARYSSYKGEISDAPENLVNRAFRAMPRRSRNRVRPSIR